MNFAAGIAPYRNPAVRVTVIGFQWGWQFAYDGQGFWLCQKRLSSGRFRYWPVHAGNAAHPLLAHELHVLLMAGDPEATGAAPQWRPVQSPPSEGLDTVLVD